MFQVRELSVKLSAAAGLDLQCSMSHCPVCDCTADNTCVTPSAIPLFACNVCNSTADGACPVLSVAAHNPEDERDGLQLLRDQLFHHLAQLN